MTHPTRAIAPVILRDYLSIRLGTELTETSVQESHETGWDELCLNHILI